MCTTYEKEELRNGIRYSWYSKLANANQKPKSYKTRLTSYSTCWAHPVQKRKKFTNMRKAYVNCIRFWLQKNLNNTSSKKFLDSLNATMSLWCRVEEQNKILLLFIVQERIFVWVKTCSNYKQNCTYFLK